VSVTLIVRSLLISAGIASIAYGISLALRFVHPADWRSLVTWLAGGVIVHDGVIAPLWLAVWWAIRRSRRTITAAVPIATGVAFTAILLLLSVPVLAPRPSGQYPADNPTLLDRPYALNLSIAIGIVWIILALWIFRRTSRSRLTPEQRYPHQPHQPDQGEQMSTTPPAVGILGGTGFYDFLADDPDALAHDIDTPFGRPSAPPVVGTVAGRRVVFIPRHGRHHEWLPHEVPYRANLWALRSLGVRVIISATAVGSLTPHYGPGTLVVPDQLIDRTSSRPATFVDHAAGLKFHPPIHISFADPYCPRVRESLMSSAEETHDGGTMIVIDGPRFSTRAESRMYATWGADLINMTGQPEATLARELGLCYAALCLVTDLDAGVAPGQGVEAAEVFAEFARNLPRLTDSVRHAVRAVDPAEECSCTPTDHDVDAMVAAITRSHDDSPAVQVVR
jgi:5'-methylthioadenosine phosphorylase